MEKEAAKSADTPEPPSEKELEKEKLKAKSKKLTNEVNEAVQDLEPSLDEGANSLHQKKHDTHHKLQSAS